MRYAWLILPALLFWPILLHAQFKDSALQQMVDAEHAFVKMAKEQSTKTAFLHYLSDDVVTTGPNGPTTGKAAIINQPANNGWLYWKVSFCDIASSGDFGFTTGPWEYRLSKEDEKAVIFGSFHSVWKKQNDGSWKNIVDIGTRHNTPAENEVISTTSMPLRSSKTREKSPPDPALILEQEKEFLDAYLRKGLDAYHSFASSEIRISREGILPIVTADQKKEFLESANLLSNLQLIDAGIASSGDLGYVYGTADVTLSTDSPSNKKSATYFRIWKKEKRAHWKIVIDVVAFE
ncbi:MAG: nuclear transport factor 2 family protein [Cyclobacteriaceae bacterium]|nr:nuclear transport factor 2 family protein [Cyclobacteriaceae bacterium]MDH5247984.1 nuclear transport factor 2 family protein [Cyclobacteriaceae bacterium]